MYFSFFTGILKISERLYRPVGGNNMRNSLQTLCEQFIADRDMIKSVFGWESSYMYPVSAAIFADQHQTPDVQRLKMCESLLKQNTGIFSNFRGTLKLPMVSLIAVSPDPEEKMRRALQVYDSLKEYFWSSSYLPIASMVMADLLRPEQFSSAAARTRHIYDLMKGEHPFLTSSEDSVFAALLALSDMDDEQIVEETENCYALLKSEFFSGNAVQSLSHVLALGDGSAETKCGKTIDLYRSLKENGMRYGREYELATLGTLALLPASVDSLTRDLAETDEFLSNQHGYGIFGPGRRQRLMHAGMLVSSDYISGDQNFSMRSAAISGTLSLIIAQQAALCAAVAASSAAAASSRSSS